MHANTPEATKSHVASLVIILSLKVHFIHNYLGLMERFCISFIHMKNMTAATKGVNMRTMREREKERKQRRVKAGNRGRSRRGVGLGEGLSH